MSRNKPHLFKNKTCVLILICTLFIASILTVRRIGGLWPMYVSKGSVQNELFLYKNNLIYGTTYSTLNSLNLNKNNKLKTFDLISGSVSPKIVDGDASIVLSGDSIWKINIKKMQKIWHYANIDGFNFIDAIKYKNLILAGGKDGSVYALNYKTGDVVWKFSSENLSMLSSISHDGFFAFFGNMVVDNGFVYYASRDGNLYTLDVYTGDLKWKFKSDSLIVTGPNIYTNYLVISTKLGNQFTLDKTTGNVLWSTNSNSAVVCSFFNEDFEKKTTLSKALSWLMLKYNIKNAFIYDLLSNGTLIKRNLKSGEIVWKSDAFGQDFKCPTFGKNNALIVNKNGTVISISLSNGKMLWLKDGFGHLTTRATRFGISPAKLKWFPFIKKESFVFANVNGKVFVIDSLSGKEYWRFDIQAPIATKIYINGSELFVISDDGVIYRINKNTGRVFLPPFDRMFKTNVEKYSIGESDVVEISLESYGRFIYPWREANLSAYFTGEKGQKIYVPGFYFDDNMWKVRFNPPDKGTWNWELVWRPHAGSFIRKGSFESNTDTNKFYLKILDNNKQRFTLDDKSIFNGIGLGMLISDNNQSGTPLDDWAIGDSVILNATDTAGVTTSIKSDKYISLNKYIETYGPQGAGFNIFRWSINNASDALDRGLTFPTTYLASEGKTGDRFLQSLRKNNIHVWLTMFGFDVPFKYTLKTNEKYLLDSYVRYIVARYSVYTDIWEIANEVSIPDNMEDFLINSIRYYDYQKKPISVSSENSGYDKSDIIAPHWYETEEITKTDIRTKEEIKKYSVYKKPIVFAEQGNRYTNYDVNSGNRMRIRSWTSFFNEAMLIFWNNSSTKTFQPLLPSGNLYIGEDERRYIKVLQEFSKSFPIDSQKISFVTNNPNIRNYGLSSNKIVAGYFYNYLSIGYKTNFNVTLYSTFKANVSWIEPSSGKVLKHDSCSIGYCRLVSPNFQTDLALKLVPF